MNEVKVSLSLLKEFFKYFNIRYEKGFYDNNLFAKIAILSNGDTNISTGTLNVNDAKEVSNKDLPGKIANTNVYIPEARNKEGE